MAEIPCLFVDVKPHLKVSGLAQAAQATVTYSKKILRILHVTPSRQAEGSALSIERSTRRETVLIDLVDSKK